MAIDSISKDRISSGFLGLSRNLWKLALVMGISQLAISLWKWQFSIFLETFMAPWQMGLVFSIGTFAGLIAAFVSGTIADYIGRKRTMASGYIPMLVGLFTLAFFPMWPYVILEWGLIWYGQGNVWITAAAIPADEIARDEGKNPARRFMMVMMPLWFFDALGPLFGSFLLSSGFTSSYLHFIGGFGSIIALIATLLFVDESLGDRTIEKAKSGPVISFRELGTDFWKLVVGMLIFSFFWSSAIQYLGNLCVNDWQVDTITYGMTWSAFSFTSAILMYSASVLVDKNLKVALIISVIGNGIVFIIFGLGSGATGLYILNIVWAIPFIAWRGSERSILVANITEERKGRALGTFDFLMRGISILSSIFGALLWELSGSLRLVWIVAGAGMFLSSVILIAVLRDTEIPAKTEDMIEQ